jgi:hypothetical protein
MRPLHAFLLAHVDRHTARSPARRTDLDRGLVDTLLLPAREDHVRAE